MFESGGYEALRDTACALADARTQTALATGSQLCDAARAVQAAQDVLDGVSADLLARMDDAAAHEDEGASGLSAWMCRELRVPRPRARARVKAGHTLRKLPDTADALATGQIRLEHVYEFTAGLTKLGASTMVDAEQILLPVAKDSDPSVLRQVIAQLHAVLYPDDLDDKWARGRDKNDVNVTKCGDGYHLSGFLDIPTGAKLQAFLKAASAPIDTGDGRAPSQRRVDALGRLVDAGVDAGEPGTGIRPQVHVVCDLDTLLGIEGADPARLAGFGPIGRELLGYLTCAGDVTPVLADGETAGPVPQADVLNVGRTSRLATPVQRAAVIARQDGVCANPGCANTTLEVHHVAWWDRDHGCTDLANLVGCCSACHHLVHREKLIVEADGYGAFTFRRSTGKRIDDHQRQSRCRIRSALRRIRHEAARERGEQANRAAPSEPSERTPHPEQTEAAAEPPPPEPKPGPPGPRPNRRPPVRQSDPTPSRMARIRQCGYQIHRVRYTDLSSGDDPPPF